MNELKVQFGSGGNILEGWRNHDLESDGVDIRKPLPYADNTVDFILAEHVLEHVTGPEALRFLDECHRILKVGGRVRVCVPVIVTLERKVLQREHMRDLTLNHGHLASYTEDLLSAFLFMAHFKTISDYGRKEIDGHWKVIGKEKDDLETCRLEATK